MKGSKVLFSLVLLAASALAFESYDDEFALQLSRNASHVGFNHTTSKKDNLFHIVTFYEHNGWGGRQWNFDSSCGWLPDCGAPHDMFTSARVRLGYAVQLFKHGYDKEWYGDSTWMRGDAWDFYDGWNDQISSFKIVPWFYDKVWLYQRRNFEVGNVCLLGPGNHNWDTLDHCGLFQDQLSSMWIPEGFQVMLFEHGNFGGMSSHWFGPGDHPRLHEIGWEDKVSSIVIRYNPAPTARVDFARGKWVERCRTLGDMSCTREYTTGVSSTDSMVKTSSYTSSFEATVSMGYEYAGFSASFSVTAGYSKSMAEEVGRTLERYAEEKLSVTCNPAGNNSIKVLYQWVMDSHNAANNEWSSVRTDKFICKMGNDMPSCPPNACADGQCNTCLPGSIIPK